MSFAPPTPLLLTRRAALALGAVALLPRVSAARPPRAPVAPPPPPPDDELAAAVRGMNDAFDAMSGAQAAWDTLEAGGAPDAAFDAAREVWEPAYDGIEAAEKALYTLMRKRGVVAVVAGGRLYIDNAHSLGSDTEAMPTYITAVEVADLVPVGPDAWEGGGR